jgi:hypothetical protein
MRRGASTCQVSDCLELHCGSYLIIEPIFSMKIKFKIDTENCIEIWGHSWCVVGKVLESSQI